MNAIIRHLASGEHYLAELDDEGNAIQCSSSLPNGTPDWSGYEDRHMQPWEDEADQWPADKFVVVHRFPNTEREG